MKTLSLLVAAIFFLAFRAPVRAEGPSFHVKFSEPLAVFMFVSKLPENSPDNPFRSRFLASRYNEQHYRDLVREFDTLSLDYSYRYYEFPYASKVPVMTRSLLKRNLIASADIGEFRIRSAGIITNAALLRLSAILEEFTPVYREIIYAPGKEGFEEQLGNIARYVRTKDIAGLFAAGLRFYGAAWDSSMPFEIAFYPLPDSKGGFTAEAIFNCAISAIPAGMKDYDVLLSVMLHEIYHILYDEQALALKTEIEGRFRRNPSKYANYAYLLLNEALATAVGNGYAFETLSGSPDSGDWYSQKYINLMGKEIFPLCRKYIAEKRTIDSAFIDSYIRSYTDNFPGWIEEMEHTMSYRYLLAEDMTDIHALNRLYPYSSFSESQDRISGETIGRMRSMPLSKLIVVSKDHARRLELVKTSFPELKGWKYRADREFLHNVFLRDGTQLYIVNRIGSPLERLLRIP